MISYRTQSPNTQCIILVLCIGAIAMLYHVTHKYFVGYDVITGPIQDKNGASGKFISALNKTALGENSDWEKPVENRKGLRRRREINVESLEYGPGDENRVLETNGGRSLKGRFAERRKRETSTGVRKANRRKRETKEDLASRTEYRNIERH